MVITPKSFLTKQNVYRCGIMYKRYFNTAYVNPTRVTGALRLRTAPSAALITSYAFKTLVSQLLPFVNTRLILKKPIT